MSERHRGLVVTGPERQTTHLLEQLGTLDRIASPFGRLRALSEIAEILTVEQARDLMGAAKGSAHPELFVPFYAIALFAGLRPGGVCMLRGETQLLHGQ